MSAMDEMRNWLSNARIVIIGVGNPLRKDDNIGVEIIRELENSARETIPESFTEPIIKHKSTHILIIDATLLGLELGASRMVEPRKIVGTAILTHALPIQIFYARANFLGSV